MMALDGKDLELWLAFIRTNAWLGQRLSRDMLEHDGIRITWYDVLVHLYHAPDPDAGLRMQDLIDRVIISNSGMTRVVDRLIEEGLVARYHNECDRREVFVHLTQNGRTLIEELLENHQARVQQYFMQHLSDDEKDVLLQVLQRIQEANQIPQANPLTSEE